MRSAFFKVGNHDDMVGNHDDNFEREIGRTQLVLSHTDRRWRKGKERCKREDRGGAETGT
jgi:hypothetical protein